MKKALLIVAGLCAGALHGETFSSGDWMLTGGGQSTFSLSYKGKKLVSDVTFGAWAPKYAKGVFGGRGYAFRREGDTVVFTKSNDCVAVTLSISLAPKKATFDFAAEMLSGEGPAEYGFLVPLKSFTEPDGSVRPCVDGVPRLVETNRPFQATRGRTLSLELPESRHALSTKDGPTFGLQDMRKDGNNQMRFIAAVPYKAPGRLSFRHELAIEDSFSAEEQFRRRITFGHARRNTASVSFSNPGFEDGKDGWRLPSKAAIDEAVAHEGKKSVRLSVDDPMKDSFYVSRMIPVMPGGQYRASCFVKTEDVRRAPARLSTVGAGLIVEWADKDGKWLSAAGGEYACGLYGTNDWKKMECRKLKADQGAAYAIVYLALRGVGRAWFDDVTLERNDVFADKFEPADGAVMANNAPFFSWRPHLGTRRYTVELSLDPKFADGTVRSYDAGGLTRFQLKDALEPGQWYWRIVALGMDDPQPWSFRQTAPKDRDCLPPQIAARGARVCGRNEPFTVRVAENSSKPPELKFADGKTSAVGKLHRRLEGGELEYRVAPPSGGWKSGLTEGRIVAKDSSGNVLDKEFWLVCAPMPQNAVVVAKDGFYEERGKRIFPLGIYEVTPKYMAEVREAGFDVVHTYRWEGSQDDSACREYLDACWKANGLRAFIGFDRGGRSRNGIVQGNFAHVARRVGSLCDHPGLFCWYLFDEPELLNQFVPPDLLIAFADLVRELDPYHPVVMSTWNKTMVEYRRAWDTHWSQAYGTPARATTHIDEHRKFLKNDSPITYLTNCNDSEQGEARKRGIEPDPTRFSRDYDELRACAMLGVVKECNGVWWWWFARETREYYTAAQCPKAWADLRKVVAELVSMRPLITDGAKARTGSAGGKKSPVEWWAKEFNGKTVVIVVNTSKEPQTVEIDPGGTVGKTRLELKRYEVRKL